MTHFRLAASAALRSMVIAITMTGSLLCPAPTALGSFDVPAAEHLTDAHVEAAITALQQELLSRRHARTLWEPRPWNARADGSPTQAGGYSALVLFALIESGRSAQDPIIAEALERILRDEPGGMYVVAVRTMLLARLPDHRLPDLERETRRLIEGFSTQAVSWTYESRPETTRRDNSLRQFGTLALRDAVRRGMPVSPDFFRMMERAMLECQLPCGGWNYEANAQPPRGSMTAGGIATLALTDEILRRDSYARFDVRRSSPHDAAIDRAMTWLQSHFAADAHPGHSGYFTYWAYSVERAALATGHRSIGGTDWFRAFAAELLRRFIRFDEGRDHARVHERTYGAANRARVRTEDLAFTLLFLSRGRMPVAVNKLSIPELRWNNRPHDAMGIAERLTDMVQQTRGWQIVSVDDPPETWLDAAFLYLASDQALPGSERGAELQERLREYLDAGGVLLAAGEAGGAFADSVERWGSAIYPHLEWRTPGAEDPLRSIRRRLDAAFPMRALGNGIRDLIILIPRGDLPGTFQRGPMQGDARGASAAHGALMENLYALATEMDRPPGRLAATASPPAGAERAAAQRPLVIHAASIGHRALPEPGALRALTRHPPPGAPKLHTELTGLSVYAESDEIDPDLLILSGIDAHPLDERERAALRALVARGRTTLLIETTGGQGSFSEQMERALAELFEARVRPIADAELRHPGDPERAIAWRAYSAERRGAPPAGIRLRGFEIEGRLRMLFSDADISHALLRRPWWGIDGLSSEDAARLVIDLARRASFNDETHHRERGLHSRTTPAALSAAEDADTAERRREANR